MAQGTVDINREIEELKSQFTDAAGELDERIARTNRAVKWPFQHAQVVATAIATSVVVIWLARVMRMRLKG